MQKRWSKAELNHLKRHAASQSVEELAQRFHTDTETVRRKLQELGLDDRAGSAEKADETLEIYTRGLERLHERDWGEAEALFLKIVQGSENRQLADRARQNLAVCRDRRAEDVTDGDPYLRAVFEKNRGNVEVALQICKKEGKEADDERYAYLLASLKALLGQTEEALSHLENAIRLEPKNRIHAYHDPDFNEVREEERFSALVAESKPRSKS